MEQQERNGVSAARYAALELLEAELRDGNRIDAEVARAELLELRARGAVELGLGEVRVFCGLPEPTVVGVLPDGDVVIKLATAESGLWPAVDVVDENLQAAAS